MKTRVQLSSKNIAMISYVVDLKSQQLNDLLQFEDEITVLKIKQTLISFVGALEGKSFEDIIKYITGINMNIVFNFDSISYFNNRHVNDEVLTRYLESKNIDWFIKADKSDFFNQALLLKAIKFNQKILHKISNNFLISKLQEHLYRHSVLEGTILDMLMHMQYLTFEINVSMDNLGLLPLIDQLEVSKAFHDACKV